MVYSIFAFNSTKWYIGWFVFVKLLPTGSALTVSQSNRLMILFKLYNLIKKIKFNVTNQTDTCVFAMTQRINKYVKRLIYLYVRGVQRHDTNNTLCTNREGNLVFHLGLIILSVIFIRLHKQECWVKHTVFLNRRWNWKIKWNEKKTWEHNEIVYLKTVWYGLLFLYKIKIKKCAPHPKEFEMRLPTKKKKGNLKEKK